MGAATVPVSQLFSKAPAPTTTFLFIVDPPKRSVRAHLIDDGRRLRIRALQRRHQTPPAPTDAFCEAARDSTLRVIEGQVGLIARRHGGVRRSDPIDAPGGPHDGDRRSRTCVGPHREPVSVSILGVGRRHHVVERVRKTLAQMPCASPHRRATRRKRPCVERLRETPTTKGRNSLL